MSTLYHISRTTGKPARCTASVRACPNGGMHFTSEAEALLNAPASTEMPVSAKLRKLGVKQVVVTDEAAAGQPTREQLLNKLQELAANKKAPATQLAAVKKQILDSIDGVIHDSGLFYAEELDGIIYSLRKGEDGHNLDLYRDDILDAPARAPRKPAPQIDFAANAEYADKLKGIYISDVRGTLPYTDELGRFVSRSQMATRLEELERTQSGWFTTAEFRQRLMRADATHLRAMKEQWAETNRDYRAEHGPATRPDFGGMIEEHERKVAESKIKREADEDSIPLSLHGFFGVKKKNKAVREPSVAARDRADVVPANAIGEFVGSVASSARRELREQRAFLKEEFNDFFNRG